MNARGIVSGEAGETRSGSTPEGGKSPTRRDAPKEHPDTPKDESEGTGMNRER